MQSLCTAGTVLFGAMVSVLNGGLQHKFLGTALTSVAWRRLIHGLLCEVVPNNFQTFF